MPCELTQEAKKLSSVKLLEFLLQHGFGRGLEPGNDDESYS